MPLHTGKGRTPGKAIQTILAYVENPEKTDHGRLITSYQCDSRTADAEFFLAKKQYIQSTGRIRGKDDVLAYHVRQAFVPGEITPEEANRLGVEFARRFTKERFAFVVCTHIDKAHVHNHIIWSAVNLDCDRKFRNFWSSTRAVRQLSDTICIEHGFSIVEQPQKYGKSYNKWLGDRANPSHRAVLQDAIDLALAQNPKSLDELFQNLQADGWQIKQRGKSISIRAVDWKKAVRLERLREGYRPKDLIVILNGKQPGQKNTAHRPMAARVNLLVDIQAKLQEGKGPGYARWAKVHNLKQMAHTMNYLREHGLLEYAALEEKADTATKCYHELSDHIKQAESRMTEISEMRTHIIQYARTREVYVAYRKAGYSKKFLAEHEAEICLHKAAKQKFDELGIKKLPTVKSLQEEYAKLQTEKKTAYARYREARQEMKTVLAAKSNVDRILDWEPEKERDRPQR